MLDVFRAKKLNKSSYLADTPVSALPYFHSSWAQLPDSEQIVCDLTIWPCTAPYHLAPWWRVSLPEGKRRLASGISCCRLSVAVSVCVYVCMWVCVLQMSTHTQGRGAFKEMEGARTSRVMWSFFCIFFFTLKLMNTRKNAITNSCWVLAAAQINSPHVECETVSCMDVCMWKHTHDKCWVVMFIMFERKNVFFPEM